MAAILFTVLLALSSLITSPYNFDLDCPLDSCALVTQESHEGHVAVDFGGMIGDPVYAAGDGLVYFAGEHCGTDPCANAITILHSYGRLATNYWHLDEVFVEKGDTVAQGDEIGTVGLTGITSGPHLHFSVQVDRVHVDPDIFLGD